MCGILQSGGRSCHLWKRNPSFYLVRGVQLGEPLAGILARLQSARSFFPVKADIHPSEDVQFHNIYQRVTEIFKKTSNFSMTGYACVTSSFLPVGSRILPLKVNGSVCDNSCYRQQRSSQVWSSSSKKRKFEFLKERPQEIQADPCIWAWET